ncbi:hypothetical protein SAMN05446589_1413 [Streptomyces sp. OV198]|nr:hypothetical protein SAMN05446589_1413 [Streptomyces sp. OV198]
MGSNRPTFTKTRPYRCALYSSIARNCAHPASCTDLPSRVRAKPFTARSSTATAWFSRINWVESWWWNSRRTSATCACARATFKQAFSRFFDLICLRDNSRCAFFGFFSARRRNRLGPPTLAWLKIRHADTVVAAVVGFTGAARQPRALAVRLPDGGVALSQRLPTALAAAVAPRLVPEPGRASPKAGDSYTPAGGDIVVEVVARTTRHAGVTVVRLR